MSLTRRTAIGAGLVAGATLAIPSLAFGVATQKRLVVIVLRGGMDGLAAVAPVGDPAYQSARGEHRHCRRSVYRMCQAWGRAGNDSGRYTGRDGSDLDLWIRTRFSGRSSREVERGMRVRADRHSDLRWKG